MFINLLISLLVAFLFLPQVIFAQTNTFSHRYISVVGVYELPYPGLLPDHPLYFLKMIRDRFISFSIQDPIKKAEFDILQADKRLNAGIYLLLTPGKVDLARSTISKGQNYYQDAIEKVQKADTQNLDTENVKRILVSSLEKQKNILVKLKALSFDVTENEKRVDEFRKKTNSIIPSS